jgi:hypothetical protein
VNLRAVGFFAGAVLGFLAAIAYDTSSNVAPLEAHRGHLTFSATLVIAGLAGFVGALVAPTLRR